MKLSTREDLPRTTEELINSDKVTYRGCGIGKNYGNTRIKVDGKEYMITDKLFEELGGINKMRFAAPRRKG